MDRHEYVRHTIDCLEEAEATLHLAQRRGELKPQEQAELSRRLDELNRTLGPIERTH